MSFETISTVYGLLPAFLQSARLADLCELNGVQTGPFGSQLHQEDYVKKGTPIITVEHLGENRIIHENLPRVSDLDKERLAKYSLRCGDIVFSRVGSVDRRALVQQKEDGWLFSGRCLRVRPQKEMLDSRWLSYFFGLSAFKSYVNGIAVGATMPSLNTKLLSDVPIYFPSLEIQRKSADVLSLLDDRITLLRETNATLEAIAQALFKSWFVDFDPVRAKMEGREPEGMDADTAALFPDGFEESELALVPRGWQIIKAGTLLTRLSSSIRYTKKQVLSLGTIPVYEQGAGILLGYHDGSAQFEATPEDPIFIFGDHTCVTHLSCEPFDISMNVIPLKGNQRPTLWTYYAVKDKQIFQEYRRHWMELVVKEVVLAPLEICKRFSHVATSLHLKMEVNERQANALIALRDTLLPRLISGQLTLI